MRVTVCELPIDPSRLDAAYAALAEHTRTHGSDLVLLPEMPFSAWIMATDAVDPARWREAVDEHERWLERLPDLGARAVLGTRPVLDGDERFNEAFAWEPETGVRGGHRKRYLPNEPGFFEATWYARGPAEFESIEVAGVRVGFLICTELGFTEHARAYAKQGIHVLAAPRATPAGTLERWRFGARTAAVMSGAFCLSSNHAPLKPPGDPDDFAGGAFVTGATDGRLIAESDREAPFVTIDIDPAEAEAAKSTYPRDVLE